MKSEQIEIDHESLAIIVRVCEGSVRDALSLLDQAIAYGSGSIDSDQLRSMLGFAERGGVIELFDSVMIGDISGALSKLAEYYNAGTEPVTVLRDLAQFIHFVTRLKYVPDILEEDVTLSQLERERGKRYAEELSVRVLGRAWQILLKGIEEVRTCEQPLPAADMVLVRLTHAADLPTPDELAQHCDDSRQLQTTTGSQPSTVKSPQTVKTSVSSTSTGTSTGTGAGMKMAVHANTAIAADLSQETDPVLTVHSYQQLITLAGEQRDLPIKHFLRHNVRLVRFENGHLEFNLIGNPKVDLIASLSAKLHQWTGQRWVIVTSHATGQQTIAEQEKAQFDTLITQVEDDPMVTSVLQQFPGSKIIDVRISQDEEERFLSDGSSENGLDDFFE